MAQPRREEQTKMVAWNQLGVVMGIVVGLLGLAAWLFLGNLDSKLDNLKLGIAGNLDSLKNEIKGDLNLIRQSIGTVEKQMEKFDARLARLEFPAFREKAEAIGIKPSLAEFRQYQDKAASVGLVAPEYTPVRIAQGFSITSEGVLADGTPYRLVYRIKDVQKDKMLILFDGNFGGIVFRNNLIDMPLKLGYYSSLSQSVRRAFGIQIPEIRIAILGRPTKDTLVFASGSPAVS